MKKILSVVLTTVIFISMLAVGVFAVEPTYSFQKAKNLVSEISGIDAAKFSVELSYRYDVPSQAWNIHYWDEEIAVNAMVDAYTGELVSYRYYKNYYPGSEDSNVPNYTRDELKDKALNFIKRYAPDKYDQIDKDPDFQYDFYNYKNGQTNYTYHFKRNIEQLSGINDGIDINQGIDISIDASTGKLSNYYINWTDISKVDIDGLLSEDEALEKMDQIMGTFLVRKQIWRENFPPENKLLYASANRAGLYPLPMGINARTGEPVNYTGQTFEMGEREEYKVTNVNKMVPLGKMNEKKAKTFVEEYLKSMGNDPEEFTLNININENYNDQNIKVYNIFADHGDKDSNINFNSVIELETGKIISLNYGEWLNQPTFPDADNGIGIEKAVETAKDYLSKVMLPFENMLIVSGKDYNYTVNFIMYQEGVLYPVNTVNVNIDNEGKVIRFNINYSDIEEIDTTGIITIEEAKAKLSQYQKLQLSFVLPRDQYSGDPVGEPIPVYQLSDINGFGIDAKTGEFVGYGESTWLMPGGKFDPYTAVTGDKNERILKIFIDTGIMPQPVPEVGENVTVGQAALILSKAFTPNYYLIPQSRTEEGAVEATPEVIALKSLIKQGVIKEDVKPSDAVTRAQIALWLSRAAGYDKLVDSDINFTLPAKDINDLDKEVKNSVAIVTALEVMNVKEGEFKPYDLLTFSDFCAIVYNAMKNM
ncbi:YcdB/YcdC domain-containing protein [Petrotoga sp. DB-2]